MKLFRSKTLDLNHIEVTQGSSTAVKIDSKCDQARMFNCSFKDVKNFKATDKIEVSNLILVGGNLGSVGYFDPRCLETLEIYCGDD